MKHDRHGYWLEEAGTPAELTPAEGELDCDVLVIGGGYTGMWTAWLIAELEPDARVVLVEARPLRATGRAVATAVSPTRCGSACRGLCERYGDGPALEVAHAAEDAVDGIEAFCSEQDVDAWFRRSGYLQVSAAPAQDGTWSEAAATAARLGEPDAVQEEGPEQIAARCASPRFRGGAFFPASATVQPARLARGLRERLAARENVSVFEHSPVRRLRAGPWGCVAETPGARIRAGSCVLAFGPAGAAPGSPLRPRSP